MAGFGAQAAEAITAANAARPANSANSRTAAIAAKAATTANAALKAEAEADLAYTVRDGDSLWNLAQRYLSRPTQTRELQRRNRIVDPYRLRPGSVLRIPAAWLRAQPGGVRLLAVAGEVTRQAEGNPLQVAAAGESLQAPLLLRTGPTGSASLQFADGSRVLMLRDSELHIRASATRLVDQAGIVLLELLRGGLENEVQPRAPAGGRFEIRTPAAIAAVRGTRFRTHADDGAAPQARAEVLEGAVLLASPAGAVTARAGQGSVARIGRTPLEPVPLLPAPAIAALPLLIERLAFDIPFPPLPGASAYRIQVSADLAPDLPVADEITPTPRLRLPSFEDGRYIVRVRGIDGQGLEGLVGQQALELRARPEAPLQIEPAPGSTTTAARPAFRWTEAEATGGYRLQISPAGAFVPLADQLVRSGTAQPERDLEPGDFQWRVASVDANGRQGPFGDAVPFRRALPGPEAQVMQPEAGGLLLRWSALPDTARYRLQVAQDTGFDAPLADVLTDAPQHALQGLAPGRYHVRVQAVDAAGRDGPWGSRQTFTVPEPPPPARWPALLLLLPLVLL